MPDLNIHASPEFLNQLDWQLDRLSILIEGLDGLSVSLRNLEEALLLLRNEAYISRAPAWKG